MPPLYDMDLSPWDYWQAGAQPKNRRAEMIAALERLLERNPSHPGAAHYYLHAMEASTHPERALPAARVLARQIPGTGHIVHMPSQPRGDAPALAAAQKRFDTTWLGERGGPPLARL